MISYFELESQPHEFQEEPKPEYMESLEEFIFQESHDRDSESLSKFSSELDTPLLPDPSETESLELKPQSRRNSERKAGNNYDGRKSG